MWVTLIYVLILIKSVANKQEVYLQKYFAKYLTRRMFVKDRVCSKKIDDTVLFAYRGKSTLRNRLLDVNLVHDKNVEIAITN